MNNFLRKFNKLGIEDKAKVLELKRKLLASEISISDVKKTLGKILQERVINLNFRQLVEPKRILEVEYCKVKMNRETLKRIVEEDEFIEDFKMKENKSLLAGFIIKTSRNIYSFNFRDFVQELATLKTKEVIQKLQW